MSDKKLLERLFREQGLTDFRWIKPNKIITGQWVRFKCMWGCSSFSKRANCPPNTPSVEECKKFIDEYKKIAVFHFSKSAADREERHAWTRKVNGLLFKLERNIFLSGYYKVFALYVDSCRLCEECEPARDKCKNKISSRPASDALCIDVFQSVRNIGFPIGVLTDPSQAMNRYGFILID